MLRESDNIASHVHAVKSLDGSFGIGVRHVFNYTIKEVSYQFRSLDLNHSS